LISPFMARPFIKDADGLALLEFAELPFFMALPLVAPSGIPDDRAAALRAAFAAMVVDPAFIDDVRKANVDLSPIDGAAIAALVAKSAATPKDVIRRYNALLAAPGREARRIVIYRGACGAPEYSTVPGITSIWDRGSWNDCQLCVRPCKSVATTL
jgi:hypothetical protein